jgi:3-oxoacyl-[acyl-carrier-protein] synthase II
MNLQKRRIVVTGLGTVNPLGNDVATTWSRVLKGESGIGRVQAFDPETFSSQIGGEVKDFDYTKYFSPENVNRARKLDKFVHYAAAATKEALAASGVLDAYSRDRIGMCVGSGIGGFHIQMQNADLYYKKGHKRVSPFYIPAHIGNIATGYLAMEFNVRGPNFSVQTACATGNHAIGSALMLIQSGMADAMVAGGTEGTILEIAYAGFCNMKALSTSFNSTPTKASRPFDKNRDGFVMAEGAGVLVLEEYEAAKKRGAPIICEIASVGMTADAYDLVAPHPQGEGAYRSMMMSLDMAGINSDEVGYVNAHGTSTPMGDIAECTAIKKMLNGHEDKVWVGSTKSMTGHLLGATSGLEAVISALVIKEGKIPPTINLDELDPAMGLTCINTQVIEKEVKVALSNSFGFGGHNSTLCLRKI